MKLEKNNTFFFKNVASVKELPWPLPEIGVDLKIQNVPNQSLKTYLNYCREESIEGLNKDQKYCVLRKH